MRSAEGSFKSCSHASLDEVIFMTTGRSVDDEIFLYRRSETLLILDPAVDRYGTCKRLYPTFRFRLQPANQSKLPLCTCG